ncbi:UDP-N-acetylmuramoyl-tripeptide--D-alanyl-D-alanine ligase [Demequina litorisediminis]|uniref:UDP-N-acetylmuramoyl-tripeptide--D-alanyl-D-alanine ligase n=1 Tax=Demequina litorisediminis TaxID=1849022 RepID=A0ABQ6IIE0_9MICO|nr:UDP-N-acetylmuramoyl-tripeptide--D-alanyl-D-alanine ligase [Demequina litorisediminis]GMA37161.1 UDP-N-acetylmuramoyl-tripeptide--D-alanyl-D-alanine ligase [Demequina litorisediminis]
MRTLTAQWIANAVGGDLAADVHAQVTSVEKDSRAVQPGALYLAFIGEHVDGHDYVPQAFEAGAALALVSQPVAGPHVLVDDVVAALGRLARAYLALLRTEGELTVIGITGSNGKTTTKDLLAQVLPDVVAPVGAFNNEIGLPLTVLRADASTRHLVLEMGASAPGDLAYLTGIAPLDVAVVLTVGSAHLGGYGSSDALAEEKASLIDGLVPGGVAVLNTDDPRVAAMARRAILAEDGRRLSLFGVGDRHDVDVAASAVANDRGRASFVPVTDGEAGERVTLTLVGEHHVTNALAAIATALECGIGPSQAAAAVAAAGPVSAHRMALTERADGVWILDDSYNASPESMRAALRALKDVAVEGRSFAVIGEMLEMGEAALAAHEEVGLDAVRLRIDHLLVVGAGARAAYVSAVREGSWGDEAAFVATIDEARAFLDGRLTRGDTVLIKASHGSGLWKLADDLLGETA